MNEMSPALCTCYKLRRASRHITKLYSAQLSSLDLKSTQFSILFAIDVMQDEKLSDIAFNLNMDRTTLTRNITPLERDGLLLSYTGEQDAREKRLKLTAAGKSKLSAATEEWNIVQQKLVAKLGKEQWQKVIETLTFLETI